MNWVETQVKKMHEKERKSFEKEQLEKLETDYKWISDQGYDDLHDWDRDENIAFAKMTLIVVVVIVGLIVGLIMWAVMV